MGSHLLISNKNLFEEAKKVYLINNYTRYEEIKVLDKESKNKLDTQLLNYLAYFVEGENLLRIYRVS